MRLTIGKKQAISVSILFFFIIAIGVTAYFAMNKTSSSLNFLTTKIQQQERILQMKFYLSRVTNILKDILIFKSSNTYGIELNYENKFMSFYNEYINDNKKNKNFEFKEQLNKTKKLIKDVTVSLESLKKLATQKKWDIYSKLMKKNESTAEELQAMINFLNHGLNQEVEQTIIYNDTMLKNATIILISLLLISILIGLIFVSMLTRAITRPISEVVNFAESIARNDLTYNIKNEFIAKHDETGDMAKAVEQMKNNLRNIIQHLKLESQDITDHIADLAHSINHTLVVVEQFNAIVKKINFGSNNQAKNVDEVIEAIKHINESIESVTSSIHNQTSAFEQFSATLEQMIASISSVANTTSEAKNVSQKLSKLAEEGSGKIVNVIEAIQEIEQKSFEIKKIVDIITGISEQTNLLAMNAAIEAAHAGQYGTGFAVVAEEIRKLADNSSSASKKIHGLLKSIILKVKNTVEVSEDANRGLDKITTNIKNNVTINTEIFISSQEQKKGADEILATINSLIERTHDIKFSINEINDDSKEIIDSMSELKNIAHDFTEQTEMHYKGSKEILNYLEGEKHSIVLIENIMEKFGDLIKQFKTQEIVNENKKPKAIGLENNNVDNQKNNSENSPLFPEDSLPN